MNCRTDIFSRSTTTLHGADAGEPEVRGVVHLHGAKAPPASDGYPEDWYVPGKSALCYYPNHQEAAMLWYHDHTMGINRLNTYAGLFGAFIVRDAFEDALKLPGGPVRNAAGDLRPALEERRPARLSGVGRGRRTVGAGGLRQCLPGEWRRCFHTGMWSRENTGCAC